MLFLNIHMPHVKWMNRLGMFSTIFIGVLLVIAALYEPTRQEEAAAAQHEETLRRGMDLYAFHCAECHGSYGQGDIQYEAQRLNDAYMRSQDYDWLYKAIARGSADTEMVAFHYNEGGLLNDQQIDSIVVLIQAADWERTAARVAALGQVSSIEQELLAQATALPADFPDAVADTVDNPTPVAVANTTAVGSHPNDGLTGRELFILHCSECHDRRGTGTADAPTLHVALNPEVVINNTRIGPENMVPLTMADLPDYQLDLIVDYVLNYHPDSTPRLKPADSVEAGLLTLEEAQAFEATFGRPYKNNP